MDVKLLQAFLDAIGANPVDVIFFGVIYFLWRKLEEERKERIALMLRIIEEKQKSINEFNSFTDLLKGLTEVLKGH